MPPGISETLMWKLLLLLLRCTIKLLVVWWCGIVTAEPHVSGLPCSDCHWIGNPGEGMGCRKMVLQYSWIQLTKIKINWFKPSHDPALACRDPEAQMLRSGLDLSCSVTAYLISRLLLPGPRGHLISQLGLHAHPWPKGLQSSRWPSLSHVPTPTYSQCWVKMNLQRKISIQK